MHKKEAGSIIKQHDMKERNWPEPKDAVLSIPATKEEPFESRNSKRRSRINWQIIFFFLAGASIILGLYYTLDDKKAERFLTNLLKRLNEKRDTIT